MKKISKALYEACEYSNEHPQDSITSVGQKFNVDRHSITAHKIDYKQFIYLYNDTYYYLTEEELAPVQYFLKHPEITLAAVKQKFGVKQDTIKRRLNIIGEEYLPRTKRHFNRNAFSDLQTEEQAYWLGFLLADGYINETRGFVKIKLQQSDEEHLVKFCHFMQEDPSYIKHDTGGSYTKDNICSFIEFNSRDLVNDLIKYNLRQAKSGKEQPIQIDNPKLQIAYIRGMIDGDGHVENGYFKYVGSLESCKYIKNFFSTWYDFKPENKYIYNHGIIYSFEVRSKKINPILQKIYSGNIYLDRKYQVVQKFLELP